MQTLVLNISRFVTAAPKASSSFDRGWRHRSDHYTRIHYR